MRRTHFGAIDVLRLGAATAVALFHYTAQGALAGHFPFRYPEIAPATTYGYLGVDLFFIISGFVIALSAHGRTAGQFLFARGKRLYPAFWTACTLAALLTLPATLAGLRQYLANMTLFAPYLGQESVDGVYWSLYMEIRFYLFVALILALGRGRQMMGFMAAWLALSAVNLVVPIPRGLGLLNLAFCPLFVSGCVYSAIARGEARRWHYGLLAAAVALSVIYAIGRPLPMPTDHLVVAALTLAAQLAIWLVASGRWRLPDWRILPWIGGLSYPVYLLHDKVGGAALNALRGQDRWLALGLTLLLVGGLAWAVHGLVERRLVPRLLGRPATPNVAVEAA